MPCVKPSDERLSQGLAKRQRDIERERRTRSVAPCPRRLGDIIVGVHRRDTQEPIGQIPVTVTGPSGRPVLTDTVGLAVLLDCDPGDYHYVVTYPPRYAVEHIRTATGDFTLAAGQIAVQRSSVIATGNLRVTVKLRAPGLPDAAVPDQDVLRLLGPARWRRPMSIPGITCRLPVTPYKASVDPARYHPAEAISDTVELQEGQTTDIELLVRPVGWVRIKVRDETSAHGPAQHHGPSHAARWQQKQPTTGSGHAEERFGKTGGHCMLEQLISEDEVAYELVSSASA